MGNRLSVDIENDGTLILAHNFLPDASIKDFERETKWQRNQTKKKLLVRTHRFHTLLHIFYSWAHGLAHSLTVARQKSMLKSFLLWFVRFGCGCERNSLATQKHQRKIEMKLCNDIEATKGETPRKLCFLMSLLRITQSRSLLLLVLPQRFVF